MSLTPILFSLNTLSPLFKGKSCQTSLLQNKSLSVNISQGRAYEVETFGISGSKVLLKTRKWMLQDAISEDELYSWQSDTLGIQIGRWTD